MPPPTDDATDLLVDADPDIRLATVLQLGEARGSSAAEALVERFGRERDFQVREALTWAVLRIPDAAVPLVRAALSSPRWLARLQAAHTLSKLADRSDGARLLPVVDDPVDCVAARAYWAVSQCGDAIAVPALVGQLGRGTAEQRTSLLAALAAFDGVVAPLVQALATGVTAAVRQHAADTIAYVGPPAADPAERALSHALRDDSDAVRLAALNALGQLRTPGAWAAIRSEAADAGRVGLLARRLLADGQDDRHSTADHQLLADGDEPVGRAWPRPDPALVTTTGSALADRLRPMLAQQVAVCRPRFLDRADVPDDVVEGIRRQAQRDALAAGRSAPRAARIAAGHVELFLHEQVLLEQVAVADPGRTIDELLYGTGVRVTDFERFTPTPWVPPVPSER